VVGGGPAGLECAMSLGKRGYKVALAERERALGGRLNGETKLPGLASWARVRDYRLGQIGRLSNIEVFLESDLDKAQIFELGYNHVLCATGAHWRRDGVGHNVHFAVPGTDAANVLTPDDIMLGRPVEGPVLIYDDDHYYMGGVIAEKLRAQGRDVTLATPGLDVSSWTLMTDEQFKVQSALMKAGVRIVLTHKLSGWHGDHAMLSCLYTGAERSVAAETLVVVTSRTANDGLYRALKEDEAGRTAAGIKTLRAIGDCDVPGAIVHATYSGHRAAREFGEAIEPDAFPYRRELVFVS
jgi:dimethylamine/trimethylamine dehydrogenase